MPPAESQAVAIGGGKEGPEEAEPLCETGGVAIYPDQDQDQDLEQDATSFYPLRVPGDACFVSRLEWHKSVPSQGSLMHSPYTEPYTHPY